MKLIENTSQNVRAIIIDSQGNVAFIKQKATSRFFWILPGGTVEYSETLAVALEREIKEETTLKIQGKINLVGIREILIPGYYRSYEYFFKVNSYDGIIEAGIDPEKDKNSQVIIDSQWIHPNDFEKYDIKPEFIRDLLVENRIVFITETFSISEYLKKYDTIPIPINNRGLELVHVMLKPDTLEHNLEDKIIQELLSIANAILLEKKKTHLTLQDLEIIYFDFTYKPAKKEVFSYLTNNETLHLVFSGEAGLHKRFNSAKGRTGSNEGLRGKYVTWYTPLNKEEWDLWLKRQHPKYEKIDMEMFCRNLLHVSPNPQTSIKGIERVFS